MKERDARDGRKHLIRTFLPISLAMLSPATEDDRVELALSRPRSTLCICNVCHQTVINNGLSICHASCVNQPWNIVNNFIRVKLTKSLAIVWFSIPLNTL